MQKFQKTKAFFIFLLLIIPFLFSACSVTEGASKIMIKTPDDVSIVGDFYDSNSNRAVLLLHMLNSNKESWNDLALKFKEEGYTVFAIDMRGHGESNLQDGEEIDWKSFDDNMFNSMISDVNSALSVLEDKGISKDKVIIGGASIGANVALKTVVQNPEIGALILLSPGMEYQGIKIKDDLEKINSSVLLISSKIDSYSYESSQIIESALESRGVYVNSIYYDGATHGTNILDQEDGASDEVFNWVDSLEI